MQDLTWRFTFVHPEQKALLTLFEALANHSYRLESLLPTNNKQWRIRLSRLEVLTAESLHRRLQTLEEIARRFGCAWEGWDVTSPVTDQRPAEDEAQRPIGICETVKALAGAVASAQSPLGPRDRLVVEVLKLMPCYRDVRRLDLWERALHDAMGEDDVKSSARPLLSGIFELARYNLYGAVDEKGTWNEFYRLEKALEGERIFLRRPRSLTDW